jgi:superfamily II DNA or RNA helicase
VHTAPEQIPEERDAGQGGSEGSSAPPASGAPSPEGIAAPAESVSAAASASAAPAAPETAPGPADEIPLFSGLSEDEFHLSAEPPRYDLVFTLSADAERGIRVRPALLRLREGLRSGGILRYKASRPVSPLRAEQQALLNRLCETEGEELPLEECLDLVQAQSELFTSSRIPVRISPASRLETAFHFQEILHDDRPLYKPEYRFLDDQGDLLHRQSKREAIVLRSKRVFCLDEEEGVLTYLPEDANTSFFVNLLLSKSQGFLSADIRGILRLTEKMSNHTLSLDENYPPVRVARKTPSPVLKLRSRQEKTESFFFFRYGSRDVPYQSQIFWLPPEEAEGAAVLTVIKRNREAESELVKDVVSRITEHLSFEKGYYAGLVSGNTEGDLRLDLSLEEFLGYYSTMLTERGIELQLEDRKVGGTGSLKFSVGNSTDWLEVDAMVEDPDSEELRSLIFDEHYQTLGLISTGDSYVRLSESDLRKLEYLRRQGMDDTGRLETSVRNFSVIDQIYEEIEEREDSPADGMLEQARLIREAAHHEEAAPPAGLQATLRPYQNAGYNWLHRLHQTGCHGCLADDMGLGKTLQTLSLLLSLKEKGDLGTSLLVAPVVTLANWEAEMAKFTPTLTSIRHAGVDRITEAAAFSDYDLVIVSYHTLRNDADLFFDFEFDYIVLDEAHYIKNAGSQIFKAVRALKSAHRLSLTGTPLENNTMELWSQFSFLNPGLLGSSKDFFARFAQPIERKKDSEALETLRDIVSPFLLRRRKEEVLKDLPPKEIIVHYSDMLPHQQELYERYRNFYRARVKGLIDDKGLAGSSVEIFQFLLKLRQLAIYPPMTGDEDAYHVGSCKMDALKDKLDEVLQEDHKILIFSQFLGSLNAMADFCRDQHWDYSLITGSTPDRAEQIRRFQEDEDVRIFLLSLKAGGVGINLTAADYVVLFDPWWNPAAERQAIDRAHRMGQTRKVISYKMITRGTIEEKILRMQEEKTALMDGIMGEDSAMFGSMSEDEVMGLFE